MSWQPSRVERLDATSTLYRWQFTEAGPVETSIDVATVLTVGERGLSVDAGFAALQVPEARMASARSDRGWGDGLFAEQLVVTTTHARSADRAPTSELSWRFYADEGGRVVELSRQEWDQRTDPVTEVVMANGEIERTQVGYTVTVPIETGQPVVFDRAVVDDAPVIREVN